LRLYNLEITKARKISAFSLCQSNLPECLSPTLAALFRESPIAGKDQTEKTFVLLRFRGLESKMILALDISYSNW